MFNIKVNVLDGPVMWNGGSYCICSRGSMTVVPQARIVADDVIIFLKSGGRVEPVYSSVRKIRDQLSCSRHDALLEAKRRADYVLGRLSHTGPDYYRIWCLHGYTPIQESSLPDKDDYLRYHFSDHPRQKELYDFVVSRVSD